ncbi:MAG TPA: hypothetical protein VE953_11055 [Terriglobales bacterium]|nr:hypothetical protein [Terriglobales bacterium]
MVQTVGPEAVVLIDHATAPVTANVPELDMRGRYSLTLTIAGPFTGTVTFEGTIDHQFWGAVELRELGAKNSTGTSTTAAGAWVSQDHYPLAAFRCSVPTLTAGDVTVTALRGA